jgi:hypothetical protein
MARMGIAVQLAGIAFAAATLLFMWKVYSPEPGRMPGVSSGPDASPWFVILALGLAATGLASLRWLSIGAGMVVVAVATVAYGLISHRLVGTGVLSIDLSAGQTVAIGAVLAIAGFTIRVATMLARPGTEPA